jgi:hypothetical protein
MIPHENSPEKMQFPYVSKTNNLQMQKFAGQSPVLKKSSCGVALSKFERSPT